MCVCVRSRVADNDVNIASIVASLCVCHQCVSVAPVCEPPLYSVGDNSSFIFCSVSRPSDTADTE